MDFFKGRNEMNILKSTTDRDTNLNVENRMSNLLTCLFGTDWIKFDMENL